jgi:hypothetical protein
MIEKVFLLHHTHVDFGYTDSREKVCRDLVDMVDRVTDLVVDSAGRPEAEQFRWTHEVSWPVLEYLRRGGNRRNELFDLLRRGTVELTALYVNPTDLFDRHTLETSTDYAVDLARRENLPLTTAMFSDCPGIAWSLPDILARRGVKYLSAAPDFIMSMPLEIERPFWWEGPEGGRVLTWMSDWRNCWYAEGLFVLKLTGPVQQATENLSAYLRQLQEEGYRWKGLAVHVAMDNEPPRPELMDFVAHWNSLSSGVQVRMATNRDFFEYMESQHAGEFAVHRGAWPDWWASGNASAAMETACSRRAKASLAKSSALAELTAAPLDAAAVRDAMEDILLFDEHTWGNQASVLAPWSVLSRMQWAQKRVYALNALDKALRIEKNAARQLRRDTRVSLANPSDTAVAAAVCLTPPRPGKAAPALADDESGETFLGQRVKTASTAGDAGDWYLVPMPPRSIRRLRRVKAAAAPARSTAGLENDHYRVEFDAATGAIRGLHDKALATELCDAACEWSFAELIHERAVGGRTAIYDVSRGTTNPESKRYGATFIRTAGHAGKKRVRLISGSVFDSLMTAGTLPGVKFLREIRLYHAAPRIDILLSLQKQVVAEYESLYLAMPLSGQPATVHIENAGAVYRAGVEQLPGSATDFQSVGHYLCVETAGRCVTIVPRDVPLVQLGDINTGKWLPRLEVKNARVFGWIMNNVWFTNFPAYQEGEVRLAWSLFSRSGGFDPAAADTLAQSVLSGAAVDDGDAPRKSLAF